jgi:replicative DNA helicase
VKKFTDQTIPDLERKAELITAKQRNGPTAQRHREEALTSNQNRDTLTEIL